MRVQTVKKTHRLSILRARSSPCNSKASIFRHERRLSKPIPIVLLLDPQTLPSFDTPRYSFGKKPRIQEFVMMGTLHGIVCFYKYSSKKTGIYLWNPSMRKLSKVPIPAYVPFTYSAFWIDPRTKHFKIVVVKLMVYRYKEFLKHGAVYSSVKGDWKEISLGGLKGIGNCFLCKDHPSVVMGKVAYWRAFYNESSKCRGAIVISFDFEQERFDCIEGPSITYDANDQHPSLCNWQGSLSLVYLDREKRCDLYSRQEGLWFNLFSISLTTNIRKAYCFLKEVGANNKILLAKTTEGKLILFDTRGGCVTLKSGNASYF